MKNATKKSQKVFLQQFCTLHVANNPFRLLILIIDVYNTPSSAKVVILGVPGTLLFPIKISTG